MFSLGGMNGDESTSKLIQVGSRIYFLVAVGLMSMFLLAVSWGLALNLEASVVFAMWPPR